jgi:hypothetical protein
MFVPVAFVQFRFVNVPFVPNRFVVVTDVAVTLARFAFQRIDFGERRHSVRSNTSKSVAIVFRVR